MMNMNVQIKHGTCATPKDIPEMYLFGSFRASERRELLTLSRDDKDLFVRALSEFLRRWAQADWLEEYSVERVGKWISKNCGQDIKDAMDQIWIVGAPANSQNIAADSVLLRTYNAFKNGLKSVH